MTHDHSDYDNKKLKHIQLNILKEFIRVCNVLRLKNFAIGGTCLGAIRHSGFIPWDDDIDVGLPRNDYNKFIDQSHKYIKDGIFLQTYLSDKYYDLNHAKLRNNNTTFIESEFCKIKINHGVFIDIFPIDGIPDNAIIGILHYFIVKLLNKITKNKRRKKIYGIFKIDEKKYINKIITALCTWFDYFNCNKVANLVGSWGRKEIVKREYFGIGTLRKFENIEVIVPNKYDLYLKRLYGNYMELPPFEKRTGHHKAFINLERPYSYYFSNKI